MSDSERAAKKWKVMLDPDLIRRHMLRGSALRLYVMLLSYKRARATAFPSRDTLAKDLGVTIRAVDAAKAVLEEKRLISWKHRKTKSGRLADEYVVGENVATLDRFDFSTSLPVPKGEESFSPREKNSSPHARKDLPPNKTNRKKTKRNETKERNNTPTGGVADAAPPLRGTLPAAACATQSTSLELDPSAPTSIPTPTSPLILDPTAPNDTKESPPGTFGLLPPWDEEDEEEEAIPLGGETDRLEAEEEEDDLDVDEQAIYAIVPEELEPVLRVYQAIHVDVIGSGFKVTDGHTRVIYNSPPGAGYLAEHFRGPLLDAEFMRALFLFCRTPVEVWPEHDWELHSNDLSPLVVLRDGPVNRLIGLVRAAQGVRNWKYKQLLGHLERDQELVRRITRLTETGVVQ